MVHVFLKKWREKNIIIDNSVKLEDSLFTGKKIYIIDNKEDFPFLIFFFFFYKKLYNLIII
jgi:hypothetical protein